ncbi:hypothetical protein NQ317_005145 [Molorchus minor]|uniref:Uncharacterized protein n=1 Tax=Molorchus minor TaxID=1323400 RepID=A0ABQ9ITG4_9CUCU|nr:hypothetical protein NQ317_005145 [Molorchus minor]
MSSSSENEDNRSRRLWADTSTSDSDFSTDSSKDYELHRRVQWSDEEFRMRFRLSKDTVTMIEQRIGNNIGPTSERNHAVTAMQQILLVLRFCAI